MNQRAMEAGVILVPKASSSAASWGMVMSFLSATRRIRKSRCGSSLE
jgi:hypothetical protein